VVEIPPESGSTIDTEETFRQLGSGDKPTEED
jgi:hypothetical protein